jgi:hypothetical protein
MLERLCFGVQYGYSAFGAYHHHTGGVIRDYYRFLISSQYLVSQATAALALALAEEVAGGTMAGSDRNQILS